MFLFNGATYLDHISPEARARFEAPLENTQARDRVKRVEVRLDSDVDGAPLLYFSVWLDFGGLVAFSQESRSLFRAVTDELIGRARANDVYDARPYVNILDAAQAARAA